jgi:hypothetical protein
MELMNVVKARAIWLFDSSDLNPRGKSLFPNLVDWLKDTYNFSKVPSSKTDYDETKALAFLDGKFQVREGTFVGVDLRMYTDGFIADTRSSTDDSDAFLNAALQAVVREFDLVPGAEKTRRTTYGSEIVVRCDRPLISLNPRLRDVCLRLSNTLGIQGKNSFDMFGFTCAIDPSVPLPVQPFRFERKLNTPFSENRYYSAAPLRTKDHLEILNELESLLSDHAVASGG